MDQSSEDQINFVTTVTEESLPSNIVTPSQLINVNSTHHENLLLPYQSSSESDETMLPSIAEQTTSHLRNLSTPSSNSNNLRRSSLASITGSTAFPSYLSYPTETPSTQNTSLAELNSLPKNSTEYVQSTFCSPQPERVPLLSTKVPRYSTAESQLRSLNASRTVSRCSMYSPVSTLDSRILVYDGINTHTPWDVPELAAKWLPTREFSLSPSSNINSRASETPTVFSTPQLGGQNKSVAWIYVFNPSPSDVQLIGEVLQLHHLTIEDIIMQETRDKCDIFSGYSLVSYTINEFEPASTSKSFSFDRERSCFWDIKQLFSGSGFRYLSLENSDIPSTATDASFDELPDLGEEYGRYRVRSLFNIVTDSRVVTFHYGNLSLDSQLLPSLKGLKKLHSEEINSLLLHRLTEIMDHQLRSLEREVLLIDDFYLISDDGDGQPHYHGAKVNASLIPVRLDQIRQAVQLWEETLSLKPAMFRSYASAINRRIASFKKIDMEQLDIQLSSHSIANPMHAWKRRNRGNTPAPSPRAYTPRSMSPALTPTSPSMYHSSQSESSLPYLDLDRGQHLVSQLLNTEGQIAAMRVAVAQSHLMIERSFGLQRCNTELSLTYRSIYQSNAMAELSGWTWVAVPLTFMSTLIGVNVMVPGQIGRFHGPWFSGYILFMLAIGLLFYLVARWGGLLR